MTSLDRESRQNFRPKPIGQWVAILVVVALAGYQYWQNNRVAPIPLPTKLPPPVSGPAESTSTSNESNAKSGQSKPQPLLTGTDRGEKNQPVAKSNSKTAATFQDGEYRVFRVADGDTFTVDNGKREGARVRLIGVNCPEIDHPEKSPPQKAQPFAYTAMDFTVGIVKNKTVRLEFDPDYQRTDDYGRWLCYVYYTDPQSGKVLMLNEELVRRGYAFVYRNRHRFNFNDAIFKRLSSAEDRATNEKLGIHSGQKSR
jgi:endonuclease YncB( thermonuclease family)